MLKHRLFTLSLLLPLFLLAIWFLPMPWFAILMALIIAVGAWEWAYLANINNNYWRGAYVFLIVVALWCTYYIPVIWILIAASVTWLWLIAAVCCYAAGFQPLAFQYSFTKIIAGFFVFIPCWVAINMLREEVGGPIWLLFGFVIIWGMDTGAYFVGRAKGAHPLISRVSPKKTWEGLWGGVGTVLLFTMVMSFIFKASLGHIIFFCLLAMLTAVFALFGDLFESMLKRQKGVKDSGNLLPGHGGILDRMDSVLAALPIFTLASMWLGNL